MGNLKQRLIKAGRDFNYAEGVKVLNNDTANALPAGTILCGVGAEGPFLKVGKTVATALATTRGRLLIAKHEIPAGGFGVALPWHIVTFDTSASAVGDPRDWHRSGGWRCNRRQGSVLRGRHPELGRYRIAGGLNATLNKSL